MIFIIIIPPPPDERPDDFVDAKYVARRFGCSTMSVYRGACGTHAVRPVSRDPWRALRSQVEDEHAKFIGSVMPKKPAVKRRVSLIRRKPRA